MEYNFHDAEAMLGLANDPERVAHADETAVYIQDPESGMLEHNDDHKAVYGTADNRIFGVVSDDYEVINPPEFFGPLAAELGERDRTVSGSIRTFDGGARGYAEVLLTDSGIWPADRDGKSEPVRTGVEVRWSHDGGVSVRASGFAQDGMCANTMRRVSNSVYVKHAGDVDERVNFADEWSRVLNDLGAFSDALERSIEGALDYEMWDFRDFEFSEDWLAVTDEDREELLADEPVPTFLSENVRDGVAGFYGLLGFPRYLNTAATTRLLSRLSAKRTEQYDGDPRVVNAWDAYSAMTWALSHEARFDNGSSSDDRYHRIASDILHNPVVVEDEAGREMSVRLHGGDEEAEEALLVEDNAGDAMRAFKEREAELRGALGGD